MSTQRDNRRHRRVGQLLQGRSTASLVERDRDLVEWCRDVVLNPVRAGMVRSARAYPWSSYRATAGLREPLALLCTAWMLAQCGAERAAAQRRYRRFVEEMRATLTRARRRQEVPRQQRYADRPTLAALFGSSPPLEKAARDRLISQAHLQYGYALAAIGKALGVHYTTISKVVKTCLATGTFFRAIGSLSRCP